MNSRVFYAFLVVFLTFSVGVILPLNFSIFDVSIVKADWEQDNFTDDSSCVFYLEFDEGYNSQWTKDKKASKNGTFYSEGILNRSINSLNSAFNKSVYFNQSAYATATINFTDHSCFYLGDSNFSIEFLVNVEAMRGSRYAHFIAWQVNNTDDQGYHIRISYLEASEAYEVRMDLQTETEAEYVVYSDMIMKIGKWQYVCITYNSTLPEHQKFTSYINGTNHTSSQTDYGFTGYTDYSGIPFIIGSNNPATYDTFRGVLDVFKIHKNKVFTPSEVANRWFIYKNYIGWYYLYEEPGNYTITNINPSNPYPTGTVPGALIRASVINPLFILMIIGVIALAIVTYYLFLRPRRRKRESDQITVIIKQK